MNHRVLLVSTSDILSREAAIIAKGLGLRLDIRKGGLLTDGHRHALEQQNKYDVFISQGGTALLMEETLSKPVISINISVADYVQALNKAKRFGRKVALVSYDCPLLKELESLAQLTADFDFKLFSYSSKADFKDQIDRVFSQSDHTVIGLGACTCEHVKTHGVNYVMVESSKENIRSALVAAKNIIDLNYKERLTASRVTNILNYSREGIFSVGKDGVIQIMNFAAEKIFNVHLADVVGKNIDCPDVPHIFRDIYEDGSFVVNETVISGETAFIVNRIQQSINKSIEETLVTFQSISDIQSLERKSRNALKNAGLVAKKTLQDIVFSSSQMRETVLRAQQFGGTEAAVLIEGETGTGKELFAQGIHNSSPRCNGPFVAINCAALPESLLESELFGYTSGAFTGARKGGKAGLFELAHNGTIFLDEIGDISPLIQSRLLRVLQEKSVLRVGGERIVDVNTRIVAATNKDLLAMSDEGTFRSDLYYRLSLLNLTIAPLRERPEDIETLSLYFLATKGAMYGVESKEFSPRTIDMMCDYDWPGNVRELENFIEKLLILQPLESNLDYSAMKLLNERNRRNELRNGGVGFDDAPGTMTIHVGSLKAMENEIFNKMLDRMDGNQTQTARRLGVSRVTLWKRLQENPVPQ